MKTLSLEDNVQTDDVSLSTNVVVIDIFSTTGSFSILKIFIRNVTRILTNEQSCLTSSGTHHSWIIFLALLTLFSSYVTHVVHTLVDTREKTGASVKVWLTSVITWISVLCAKMHPWSHEPVCCAQRCIRNHMNQCVVRKDTSVITWTSVLCAKIHP